MGLMLSLHSAVSGLRNHQVMMDVIGNNISNVNTIGFKTGRVSFSETFAQTLRGTTQPLANVSGTNPIQVGLGMSLSTIDTLFSQGNIETTGQSTDLAIQGEGFFVLSDGNQRFYSRAGSFQLDANGNLIQPANGMRVQGYMADDEGTIRAGTQLGDITLALGKKLPGTSTTEVSFGGNLDASAEPQGNILETGEVYALEQGDSDVDGLLSIGTANRRITGMIPQVTDMTITHGTETFTYTYVSTDASVGNGQFNTLNDLIAEINNDFTALTASLTGSGEIQFSGNDVLTIDSNNQILKEAFQSANVDLSVAGTSLSDQFSHTAKADDLLINLRDENGASLGLTSGDEITINGLVGGDAITAYNYGVSGTSTYENFSDEIEAALSLTNSDGVEINSDDGSLKIHGDGGLIYELSDLDIQADDTPGAGGTARTVFNGIFDDSEGNYDEIQEAEDVQKSASITVYDSQGNSFDLTMIFTKDVTTPNRWLWEVQVPEPAVATAGTTGYVTFNTDGSLHSFHYDDGSAAVQIQPGAGADIMSVDLNMGVQGEFEGLTQLSGSNSDVVIRDQDGYGMGTLSRINIDQFGRVLGEFNNGALQILGQITLATFNNPGGLFRSADSLFEVSSNSGNPLIGTAGEGINASIIAGALEQSSVDLAEEFTKMIVAQRGFQANARVITTSDDLLAEVTNLKRR